MRWQKKEARRKKSEEKKNRTKEHIVEKKKEENKMNEGASEGVSETDRNRKAAKGKFHT